LPGALLMSWDAEVWMKLQLVFLSLVPAMVLWYLPLAGYLLLISVWARKNAFLWAVLPPVALLLVEGMLLSSNHFGEFLARRIVGPFQIMAHGDNQSHSMATALGDFMELIGRVFAHYETWLGVLVAVAFLVAVIRIRRYRDDS
jgi:ABC-2 type transport system permease protein